MIRDDTGASIVELSLAMVVTSLMAVALVTWMSSAGASLALHREDDYVVQDLRIAKEVIGRELRIAESVLVARADLVTVWIDEDHDDYLDPGESITWSLGTDGTLRRATDLGDEQIVASRLLAESRFGYDHPSAELVGQITVRLVAEVAPRTDGGEPGRREIGIQIYLRNRP